MTYRNSNTFGEFKKNFLNSPVFEYLLTDECAEPLMIYLTGSNLTGCIDADSDYDLCVLVRDLSKLPTHYQRPTSWWMLYTPEARKCQIIYNDFSSIFKVSVFPQDNVGWAQFKYITDEYLFYVNPKYQRAIDLLIQYRQVISDNALYLFGQSCALALKIPTLSDLDEKHLCTVKKLAYQLVWAGSSAAEASIANDFLIKIKRVSFDKLTSIEQRCVVDFINLFVQYINKYTKSALIEELENTLC